ncbi:hypothetical protein V8C86DRAFT_2977888 [Haematococcus lacustris]
MQPCNLLCLCRCGSAMMTTTTSLPSPAGGLCCLVLTRWLHRHRAVTCKDTARSKEGEEDTSTVRARQEPPISDHGAAWSER